MQQVLPELNIVDPATGLPGKSAVYTVERFQSGERTVVLVTATAGTCWPRPGSCSTPGG